MYCSIVWRSSWVAILLVVMIIPACSVQTKSVLTFNLIFLRALLILTIWVFDSAINFTCFTFTTDYLLDIFNCRLRKVSLIFKTFLVVLAGVEAWVYNFFNSFFLLDWLFFLKYFEISLISLGNLAGIRRESLLKVVGKSVLLLLLLLLIFTSLILRVNFAETLLLNKVLFLSVIRKLLQLMSHNLSMD